MQAVGVSFPLRATEDDVARQLAQMLPMLREQGMRQIAEETRHDFLLRLGQRLIDGDRAMALAAGAVADRLAAAACAAWPDV